MTGTATYVKDRDTDNPGVVLQRVYRLTPPMPIPEYDGGGIAEYVLVSAANIMFSGPETYIFPCDAEGEVLSWGELDGSYKGGLDHDEALGGAGYEVQS